MKYASAIIPFILLLAGCDAADLRDIRSASLKLQQGMTEVEAINVVGFPPDSADLGTCGTNTKKGAWTCRTLTFNGLGNNHRLMVIEALVDKVWRVNSWSVI
jgi:hypothetical protein